MTDSNVIIIITGLSGAGKTQALRCFEDMGFFCVDNLIPPLLPQFIELVYSRCPQLAIVADSRGGVFFAELLGVLENVGKRELPIRILFLEAADDVLFRRFSETRRRHPLWGKGSLLEAIGAERVQLTEVRARASVVMDTSDLSNKQFKEKLMANFILPSQAEAAMQITIISFGYKFGTPLDADLLFDVRFLPNPHYDRQLRPFTGMDLQVQQFVINHPVTQEFLQRFLDLTEFLIPHYQKEGKTHLAIAIGCTGGRHRSVAIAHYLAEYLRDLQHSVVELHRDIERQAEYYAALGDKPAN
ncbi:MAG: RNase adapter RapZ [Cyanobacteria bacterium NC_groundwater_1444_Ag_S-0.65um_54_12]|nr:RNase adapter RapZ [Cyanobacteria bacterium NC_groundwater_1444_Ag_S-0.65um_54_12]